MLAACGNIEHNYNLTRNQVKTINDFDIRADWVIGPRTRCSAVTATPTTT